jgi:hypothetical protein
MIVLSLHGIHTSRRRKGAGSVTHVSGTNCNPCVEPLTELAASAPFEWFTLEINPLKIGEAAVHAVDGLLVTEP